MHVLSVAVLLWLYERMILLEASGRVSRRCLGYYHTRWFVSYGFLALYWSVFNTVAKQHTSVSPHTQRQSCRIFTHHASTVSKPSDVRHAVQVPPAVCSSPTKPAHVEAQWRNSSSHAWVFAL